MLGKRKIRMKICVLAVLAIMLVCQVPPAEAGTVGLIYTVTHNGDNGAFGFTAVKNETLTYKVTGTVRFSILVMDSDNYNRSMLNESFAYISELSAVNVTYASYDGPIGPGTYWALMYIIGPDNITGTIYIYNPVFEIGCHSHPSDSDISIPWDIVITAAVTAIVVSIGTIAVVRKKRNE